MKLTQIASAVSLISFAVGSNAALRGRKGARNNKYQKEQLPQQPHERKLKTIEKKQQQHRNLLSRSPPSHQYNGWEKHKDTACGFGGNAVEGFHFNKYYGVSKDWCQYQCEGEGQYCQGYDYDYDRNRCRVFYETPWDNKYKDDVTCWLRPSTPTPPTTYEKYEDTACGFGGNGVEGYHFDKWYDVSRDWCFFKCEDEGQCQGYDFDFDKDRCRVFYEKPRDSKYKQDVTCYLKTPQPAW